MSELDLTMNAPIERGDYAAIYAELTRAEQRIAELDTHIDTLNFAIRGVEKKWAERGDRIAQLEGEIAALRELVATEAHCLNDVMNRIKQDFTNPIDPTRRYVLDLRNQSVYFAWGDSIQPSIVPLKEEPK